ncbi:MAG: hypothetical protein HY888_03015 [Deltaproteobacteria bacterium]|nr:hypothetical protein [Deltaproteobacteria bacterium]
MTEFSSPPQEESEDKVFPVEPRYHPIHKIPRKIYDFLASAKLAMVLLITILVCCVAGATLFRGARAGEVIFGSIWFNAILVLLIVNVACCFFGRIWHRKLTIISFGMILFHLSFVSILGAVVYNSLFYFRGNIRMTEGESLPSGDPHSYDSHDKGVFFNFDRLKGETSLIRMHTGYKISGEDKRAAYEISVGEGTTKKQGIVYITNKLTHNGVDYFNDKEGYTVLLTLADKQGQVLYGAYFPLQSIPLADESFQYSFGYKDGDVVKPDVIPFPSAPEPARFALQVVYHPSRLLERKGEARFMIYGLDDKGMPNFEKLMSDSKVLIGESLQTGDLALSAKEVRYWVSMSVRHEPGKPIVLTSLWAGLAGMIITTLGRMFKKPSGKKSAGLSD